MIMNIKIFFAWFFISNFFLVSNVNSSLNHHRHEGSQDHHRLKKSSKIAGCNDSQMRKFYKEWGNLVEKIAGTDDREKRLKLATEYREIMQNC